MPLNDSFLINDAHIGAYSAGSSTRETPAVLVLHEIFGVNENIRKTVERLASMGYRAVAPDLFWRQEPGVELNPDEPQSRERSKVLTDAYNADLQTGINDISSIITQLRDKHEKVAVLGYCLGGKLAFLAWLNCPVDAAVGYYGVGLKSLVPQVASQSAPLLLHFGKDDPLNPPEAVEAIKEALAPLSNAQIVSYDGVGHAFARLNAKSYVASAAEQADSASFKFLKEHLGK